MVRADNRWQLSSIVSSYQALYAAADDKYSKDEFEKKVPLEFQNNSKGIEVGHIFNFSTKYSEPMKANVLNSNGKAVSVHMGSYGIYSIRAHMYWHCFTIRV